MKPDQITQEVWDLMDESQRNAVAKAFTNARVNGNGKLSCKVGAKGGVSVYGLGRFPVTLYGAQWERLLNHRDSILAFIDANADTLSVK